MIWEIGIWGLGDWDLGFGIWGNCELETKLGLKTHFLSQINLNIQLYYPHIASIQKQSYILQLHPYERRFYDL